MRAAALVGLLSVSIMLADLVLFQPGSTPQPTAAAEPAAPAPPAADVTPTSAVFEGSAAVPTQAPPPTLSQLVEATAVRPTTAPPPTPDAVATRTAQDAARVEQILSTLTDDQKIGQLLMLGFGGTTPDQAAYLIRTYHPGSIVFWQNTQTPQQTQALTRGLQSLAMDTGAGLPLFVAVDHEGGQVQRLTQGVTYFPSKRVLGATYNPDLARLEGGVEGRELRALGINMNLGPVLDVDSNPNNPIIGGFERSLGADPSVVAGLGVAYIQGLQSERVLAVAKHFPGHGDTRADSHVTLPYLPLTLDDLSVRELIPFGEAAKVGVGAMMTAHLMIPQVDPNWPSSLSHVFVTDVLRGTLGFDGLVMTDDMGGMAAITSNYTAGGAAVRAIEAGNDLAMIVGDASREAQAFAALKQAVASGEISQQQLNTSVRRVLRAKLSIGLLDDDLLAPVDLPTPDTDALQRVADGGITLVQSGGRVPVIAPSTSRVLVISPASLPIAAGGTQFGEAIRARVPATTELVFQLNGDNSAVLREALADSRVSDVVIVGTSNAGPWQQGLIRQLSEAGAQLIVVGFGAPNEVAAMPQNVPYYAAFLPRREYVEAAVKVLFGEMPASGRLPIPIGPYHAGWNASDQP
jgi:beta-N-acetylhexosaminidase